ncbi:class I SAM-dependent methyltransferase [Acidobacteria bacterium AH-259-D05]|nr:class I SAM-dependent methyltransferase [Acidobacteria bacterium AH-259-D05]
MCKKDQLFEFLDLGSMPPADQFRRRDQLQQPDVYYPLKVLLCDNCGLVQLDYVVSPEVLYRNDYPYEASITQSGREHWAEFAKITAEELQLGGDDLVVDIGSNVGVLLNKFKKRGLKVVGVDPAANIVRIAEQQGIETFCEFFSVDTARLIVKEKGRASLVTATNVFAHIDDLDGFCHALDELLTQKGVFILEAPYFVNLVGHLEYDTIYHEHLTYLSVKPLVPFFQRFGLEIFKIRQRDIHGGSFRVFVRRRRRRDVLHQSVEALLALEEEEGIHTRKRLVNFASAVQQNRQDLIWLLQSLKHDGRRLVGISAPAKGMTLLNYCHIGSETLDFVTEKSRLKIGRFTPGTHIPVMPDEVLMKDKPDYGLLLAWNFADEIMTNLKAYKALGGKFILPIPSPEIVD